MAAASPFLAPPAAADPSRPLIAYVGCRTTRAKNASGKGITVWRVERDGWEQLQLVEAEDDDPTTPNSPDAIPINPSFLTLDPTGRFLYTVHGDATKVTSFAVATDGTLTRLNTVDTGRPNGVHLAVDPTGRWLVVAHLSAAGSVTTLPIRPDGFLGEVTGSLVPPGTPGPHKTAQLGPNPHHAPFDPTGRWVLIPDRGLDRVFVAKLDPATGGLAVHGWGSSRELDGPRHIAVNPVLPYLYAINELRSTLTAYRWDAAAGTVSPHRTVAATAPDMVTDSRGGGDRGRAVRPIRVRVQPQRHRRRDARQPRCRHDRRVPRRPWHRGPGARRVGVHAGHPAASLRVRSRRTHALRRERGDAHCCRVRRRPGLRPTPGDRSGDRHTVPGVRRLPRTHDLTWAGKCRLVVLSGTRRHH
jgi:6-phosphogluconolactonase (cycloisomerase 2 family)